MFGPNKLQLWNTYTSPDGRFYNFQDFKVYLSHIKLIYTNGTTTEVEPIAYFTPADSQFLSITVNAPTGSFKGIEFNIGLDSVQNSAYPSNDTTSPLAYNNNTYWGIQNQFVFVEMDGTADTFANSSYQFAYHVGTNPYYTVAPPLYQNFTVSGGGKTVLTLTADAQKMFYGSPSINIFTDPTTMTTGSAYFQSLAHTVIADFSQIFSLQGS